MGESKMDKKPLIGGSILAVVLLVLGSLSNVVGYQAIQLSNQKVIKNEANQKELLFQTIIDITNNKEIQKIILKYQLSRESFINPSVRFPVFSNLVLTKNQLKHMYIIGLMFTKIFSKSRIHSMIEQFKLSNQEIQKEISVVIEKDAILNAEITQLSNSECDCENKNTISWHFPIICTILLILYLFIVFMWFYGHHVGWFIIFMTPIIENLLFYLCLKYFSI
jgi:hypothetical protein